MPNPIGRVARLLNPRLVKVEERVDFLNQQLMTLAVHEKHDMKSALGARGAKLAPDDPDPMLTIDLGKSYPIESLFLVPLLSNSEKLKSILPKCFTIEFSEVEDFSEHRVLYSSMDRYFPETGGKPIKFNGQEAMARYVRLTVNQGHPRGKSEIFGLSEIVVISNGYPVSFGKKVSVVGALNVENIWYPDAITDGRMPLGVWEGGEWAKESEKGDLITTGSQEGEISWTVDLGETCDLDTVILYPLEVREVLEAELLPEKMEIQIRSGEGDDFETVAQWENPVPESNQPTPLIFPLNGRNARELRILGKRPRNLGDKFLYGLAEIEIWSDQQNISESKPVIRDAGGVQSTIGSLTNGYASARQILPVGIWLNQLHDRWRVEREIQALDPMRTQMASESELNATWGSAMMLGLTFLIPVFIVERRRLISRNQMDQLRKRIASDLHDDIGSNLGSISLIARTAKKDLVRLHGPEEVGEDLDEVESIARESSLAMRDIVWLLERQQDSIGDLVARMRETATRLLREVNYTIDCESSKTTAKLSLDAKRHLFLFYKEAIHNILKHSKASEVSIKLWDIGDKLAMEIIDNGRGLPTLQENQKDIPKLIAKLDERARVLEGQLDVKSERDIGTRILLTVKRSLLIAAPAIK
ncbi:sensor histidine kinase [Luteolibacter algae]|uniref:histidine kinase n=1 Tax=Luteolibacter algae TaxID=454151 RepID=A0ABW5DCI7_9BACT